jgi:hypothetical protein
VLLLLLFGDGENDEEEDVEIAFFERCESIKIDCNQKMVILELQISINVKSFISIKKMS